MNIFLIVFGIFLYLNIGCKIGIQSWLIYMDGGESKAHFILWPFSTFFGCCGSGVVGFFNTVEGYLALISIFWLPKVLWNIMAILIIFVIRIIMICVKIITYVPRRGLKID